ncbi:hypothetical protein Tfer_0503 [Thermincola ferriacetica]|uniref:DUF2619 domain-containing protein n=2 Tax=Thermincola TaxID=278993 RepID=D5XFB2_THEPJ|nr:MULTISPECIES: YqhV family protein [Thermincola]ADG82333.1 conserved hypothetical protein [Thermincola potens JR]KNZ70824.1 hypothetical protein Tfer_0503 [Thermincola ferriacetica]
MFLVKDKIVFGMAMMRCLSSLIELTAALLMLKFDSVGKALKINAALAFVGPTIMLTVTTLGLIGLSGKLPLHRFILIFCGVILIFAGIGKAR